VLNSLVHRDQYDCMTVVFSPLVVIVEGGEIGWRALPPICKS